MHFLRLIRTCATTSTNRPNWLIGNDRKREYIDTVQIKYTHELFPNHPTSITALPLLKCFPHTNNRFQFRSDGQTRSR